MGPLLGSAARHWNATEADIVEAGLNVGAASYIDLADRAEQASSPPDRGDVKVNLDVTATIAQPAPAQWPLSESSLRSRASR